MKKHVKRTEAILTRSRAHKHRIGEIVTILYPVTCDAYKVEFSDGTTGIAFREQLGVKGKICEGCDE